MSRTIGDGAVKELLSRLGYPSLYPPQKMAYDMGILDGRSMLVTTPTASGKTLIALMAALRAVEKSLKAVYMTPLRALANEKYDDMKILEEFDFGRKIRVALATSDYDSSGIELAAADVIVLTNEKMDTLFRHNAEWLGDVGLYVADEIHLITDRERGPTLEMMLTKIRKHYPESQVLALSATVSNSKEIADWLGCELVESNWRPTKLVEGVFEYSMMRMSDGSKIKVERSGVSSAIDVAVDSLDGGGQALIFAETRKRAVSLAAKAAEGVYKRLDKAEREAAASAAADILSKGDDSELTKTLSLTVAKGVAFHHAGIGLSGRKIVEESFKRGTIKILTATPTLAAGVNLPARRVVLASVRRYDSEYGWSVPISVLEYKQLCGRAGRPKFDISGEAIIVVEDGFNADEIYDHYVLGTTEPLRSQLSRDSAIRFHLLSTIASMPGMKKPEIHELFSGTLLARQYGSATLDFKIESALGYLEDEDLIKSKYDRYIATDFGRRTSLLYIDPATAVRFRNALERVGRAGGQHTLGFIHLITDSADFYPRLQLRKKDYSELSVLVQERRNELFSEISEFDCTRSFWALCEWIEEAGDKALGEKIGVEPGDMHRMVELSEWLAHSLYELAKLIGREDLLVELRNLRTRIRFGVKDELLPLVGLDGIGRVRARSLHNAGLTDLSKIAKAPKSKLANTPKIGPVVAEKLKDQLKKLLH